jgi:hypothetical protein
MRILKSLSLTLFIGAAVAVPLLPTPIAHAQVGQIDLQPSMAAIINAGSRANKVKSITKVPSVGVVRLDFVVTPLLGSGVPSWQEYRVLAQRNAAGVRKLQQALMANPVTRDALADHGIEAWQVAGAQISSKGSLRLYIFSRWERRPF